MVGSVRFSITTRKPRSLTNKKLSRSAKFPLLSFPVFARRTLAKFLDQHFHHRSDGLFRVNVDNPMVILVNPNHPLIQEIMKKTLRNGRFFRTKREQNQLEGRISKLFKNAIKQVANDILATNRIRGSFFITVEVIPVVQVLHPRGWPMTVPGGKKARQCPHNFLIGIQVSRRENSQVNPDDSRRKEIKQGLRKIGYQNLISFGMPPYVKAIDTGEAQELGAISRVGID